ncbi:hypothetical protein FISHEDRAFT_60465 [Fistulina hepatica ATCC 64428]|uniref:Uncharacterized protein n=1 Tax=Fistulina hepatica ATCC 64428 TaxID=1128425 RepID=A0A0D7A5S5_9AGAR|nr:hypothetical protein FISHEDRAFT_60465 [Fistulina hepatica ATCC 64428]
MNSRQLLSLSVSHRYYILDLTVVAICTVLNSVGSKCHSVRVPAKWVAMHMKAGHSRCMEGQDPRSITTINDCEIASIRVLGASDLQRLSTPKQKEQRRFDANRNGYTFRLVNKLIEYPTWNQLLDPLTSGYGPFSAKASAHICNAVDGQVYGIGVAGQKSAAKEHASKQALEHEEPALIVGLVRNSASRQADRAIIPMLFLSNNELLEERGCCARNLPHVGTVAQFTLDFHLQNLISTYMSRGFYRIFPQLFAGTLGRKTIGVATAVYALRPALIDYAENQQSGKSSSSSRSVSSIHQKHNVQEPEAVMHP